MEGPGLTLLLGIVTPLTVTTSKVWWQQPGPSADLRAPGPWQRAQLPLGGPSCQPNQPPGTLQETPLASPSQKPLASSVGGSERTRGLESTCSRLVKKAEWGPYTHPANLEPVGSQVHFPASLAGPGDPFPAGQSTPSVSQQSPRW